jgi:FkbM family methyltransferase
MISYAGNREDVLLRRVFHDQKDGFYVDVGAGDPEDHSLTKHFYDRGWRGVNVEPTKDLYQRLVAQRERDINLNIGLSSKPGTMTLFKCPPEFWGFSTMSADQAAKRRAEGVEVQVLQVVVSTLARVCEEHVKSEIDFLSIDVEGLEAQVIEGGDWRRWRPRVVIVEATEPNSTIPSHEGWEPLLLGAGYNFVYFDGLNRYYLRSEDAHLTRHFEVPVNVFDNYEPFEYVRQIKLHQRAAMEAEGRVTAERALREASDGIAGALWANQLHIRQRLDELKVDAEELRSRGGALEQGRGAEPAPGPLAMSVARVLARTATRFPRAASIARVAVRGAIKLRRSLARARG